jgi:S-DNA-T family DNA segregation ATPase FtsK/SpoIIIE
MTLTCSVALYPGSDEVANLAKLVQDEERIEIEGPPDLFAVDPGEPAGDSTVVMVFDGKPSAAEPDPDSQYQRAVEVVLKNQKASISLVQRHLAIGYNTAARLLEEMEKRGVVSAMSGNGSRRILTAGAPQ